MLSWTKVPPANGSTVYYLFLPFLFISSFFLHKHFNKQVVSASYFFPVSGRAPLWFILLHRRACVRRRVTRTRCGRLSTPSSLAASWKSKWAPSWASRQEDQVAYPSRVMDVAASLAVVQRMGERPLKHGGAHGVLSRIPFPSSRPSCRSALAALFTYSGQVRPSSPSHP